MLSRPLNALRPDDDAAWRYQRWPGGSRRRRDAPVGWSEELHFLVASIVLLTSSSSSDCRCDRHVIERAEIDLRGA